MKKIRAGILGLALAVSAVVSAGNGTAYAEGINPYDDFNWQWVTTDTELSRGYSKSHKGMDIAVNKEPVYSPQRGTVLSAGYWTSAGNYVAIETRDKDPDTNSKLVIRFLHLKSKSVSTGDSVSKGEEIAVSGNTGTDSTGPHLHIDINNEGEYDGKDINYSNTIDPKYFWPHYFDGPTFAPHEEHETEEHQTEDELLRKFDSEEYFFEDTLINYVGEEEFMKWINSQPLEDQTVPNFKKAFNISDEKEKKLKKQARE
ncbi:M23 family metallopeptidase [Brevibacillus porteri]|uniref:M23 family peptidase n=2 Tax=Brevibacillus porteri TaxID=2126350 RepID=A0ABX5FFW2_9BACL|nr:M23 family metallopeptidase [Brevibacillus porteri]MED2745718.1 M23 family metallopeptidase [Brevibacillus porteri]MED2816602.1 M23 family metallopeptidase [Brevibacillus porteri]MED2897395.1 M23 family metallopeptidase [Brevibacillus porteri]MED4894961.1 M23 family metallopeptidase [Brevibacillus porteri]PSK01918.1 M23 family peptidase [Brevibacillus porteri]